MEFNRWRELIFKDLKSVGLRPTARKFGLSVSSLQNIIAGGEGRLSWQRLGAHLKESQLKDEVKK